jgi:hypothetical protein
LTQTVNGLMKRSTMRARALTLAGGALLMVLPSAVQVVRFDRFLGTEDNRLVAARWLDERRRPGQSVFQAGSTYGQLQLASRPPMTELIFDEESGRFIGPGGPTARRPDWIVLPESPLWYYTQAPGAVVALVGSEYEVAQAFPALDMRATGNLYDQQDAFFAPYAGWNGVERPGPNIVIYRRRPSPADVPPTSTTAR